MKKTVLFSAAMSGVLATSLLATPMALAYTNTDTSSIDIQGVQADVTADAYQFVTVNWDNKKDQPSNPQYTWASEIADWVKANFPEYIGDGNRVTDKFEESLSDAGELKDHQPVDNGAASFYDKLAKAIKAGDVTLKPAKSVKATGETASIPDMGIGGYLVLFSGGTDVYRPSVAIVKPTYDDKSGKWNLSNKTDLTVKKSAIPLTKTVDDKAVGIESIANFTLTSAVPVYPENAVNKTFLLVDNLSDSLTLQDGISVVGVKTDGSETPLKVNEDYQITAESKGGNAVSLSFDFTYDKVKQYDSIKVQYKATVNDKATAGTAITNEAYVNYASDPYTAGGVLETPGVTVNSWTYGLEMAKIDGKTNSALPGAKFAIQGKGAGGNDNLLFNKIADGHYKYTTLATPQNTPKPGGIQYEETSVKELSTDAQGKLQVDGLDAGDYQLIELQAPAGGYVKLEKPIDFTITDEDHDGVVDANASAQKGYVTMTVQNTKGFSLPVTGAAGIAGLTAVGLLFLSVGGVLVARRKRAHEGTSADSE